MTSRVDYFWAVAACACLATAPALSACGGNTALPEPDSAALSTDTGSASRDESPADTDATSAKTKPSGNAKPSPQPSPTKAPLAPGEFEFVGTLKKLHYEDMVPPDILARNPEFTDPSTYYVIELDEPTEVVGTAGPSYAPWEASFAIVGKKGAMTDAAPDWDSYVGKRVRAVAHQKDIVVPTEIGTPYSAVRITNSKYPMEVLG